MIIGLTTKTFDLQGALILRNAESLSKISAVSRRLRKSATLDGGVDIENSGFSQGDRKFQIVVPVKTEEQYNSYLYLIATYPEVIVSTREGSFLGAFSTLKRSGQNANMIIEIKSKIT